jgi:DNA-directed RNA polymerase I, II, and III subunit RPABC1
METIRRIWNAWKTITEMLTDRRYHVPEGTLVAWESFAKKWGTSNPTKVRASFTELFAKKKDDDPDIMVLMRESIGNAQIQEIYTLALAQGESISSVIVVYTDKVTPSAEMGIRQLRVKRMNIQCFTEDSLQYNVTHHKLVPRHTICSMETKTSLMKQYHTDKDHLPQIKATDPVCAYLGAKKGQLIEIVRKSDSVDKVEEGETEAKKTQLYDITYKIVI